MNRFYVTFETCPACDPGTKWKQACTAYFVSGNIKELKKKNKKYMQCQTKIYIQQNQCIVTGAGSAVTCTCLGGLTYTMYVGVGSGVVSFWTNPFPSPPIW